MGRPTYDVVLFGATGFTGGLVADYLATHAPAGCRWAVAGRDRAKLDALTERLARQHTGLGPVDSVLADVTRTDTMRALAASARVVISTVGPFIRYGEPLVAACAEAGTDYVDLTGEAEFVDLMFARYHERARQTGARLVHACGFDSIPFDLGVAFTVGLLPSDVPITVDGYVRAGGQVSGGTYHSAVHAFARGRQLRSAATQRRDVEARDPGRRVRGRAGGFGRSSDPPGWTLPLPTIDPQIVARSARALDCYGPDFTYRHHALVSRLPVAVGAVAAAGSVAALAQLPPTRDLLLRRLEPGQGPSARRRARSWFRVRFVGRAGQQRVVTEVSGGDPGYGETAKMVSEAALCLAYDDNPPTSGQVTTAVAMGEALTARLVAAGIAFEVVETA